MSIAYQIKKCGFWKHGVLIITLLLLASCSPPIKHRSLSANASPAWVRNHPASRTHFIGIGSAEIDADLNAAQKLARSRALQDIAEQIQVAVVSEVRMFAQCNTIDDKYFVHETFQQNIEAFSKAVLSDWEEKNTFSDASGFFWSKVIISKKEYYAKVNKTITDAAGSLCDIIKNSSCGSARFRLEELCRGFYIIDGLFNMPLYGKVQGREVLLNNELTRCMRRLLESIEIRPSVQHADLDAVQQAPEHIGVYVFLDGKKDRSLAIGWSSSLGPSKCRTLSPRSDGMYAMQITSVPPKTDAIKITAAPDLNTMTYELIRRKFIIPACTFTLQRQRAQVYIEKSTRFCSFVARELGRQSAITIVPIKENAQFILTSDFEEAVGASLENSIFRAQGRLHVRLSSNSGADLLDYSGVIESADGMSAQKAIDNTRRSAVEVAVNKIQSAF